MCFLFEGWEMRIILTRVLRMLCLSTPNCLIVLQSSFPFFIFSDPCSRLFEYSIACLMAKLCCFPYISWPLFRFAQELVIGYYLQHRLLFFRDIDFCSCAFLGLMMIFQKSSSMTRWSLPFSFLFLIILSTMYWSLEPNFLHFICKSIAFTFLH